MRAVRLLSAGPRCRSCKRPKVKDFLSTSPGDQLAVLFLQFHADHLSSEQFSGHESRPPPQQTDQQLFLR